MRIVEQIHLGAKGAFKDFEYLAQASALEISSSDTHLLVCNVWPSRSTMGTRGMCGRNMFQARSMDNILLLPVPQLKPGLVLLLNLPVRLLHDVNYSPRKKRITAFVLQRLLTRRLFPSILWKVRVLEEPRPRRLPIGSHLQFGILKTYTELFLKTTVLATFDGSPRDDEVVIVGLTVLIRPWSFMIVLAQIAT